MQKLKLFYNPEIIAKMSEKNKTAKISYWKNISAEEKSKRATKMIKARWAKLSKEERSEIARQRVAKRWAKHSLSTPEK